MNWTTDRPTEPGFYFATDGSPLLILQIYGRDMCPEECWTWQTAWPGHEDVPATLPETPELKYWLKIPLPDKPDVIS